MGNRSLPLRRDAAASGLAASGAYYRRSPTAAPAPSPRPGGPRRLNARRARGRVWCARRRVALPPRRRCDCDPVGAPWRRRVSSPSGQPSALPCGPWRAPQRARRWSARGSGRVPISAMAPSRWKVKRPIVVVVSIPSDSERNSIFALRQIGDQLHEPAHRAAEAVELVDHDHVTLPAVAQRVPQPRPVVPRSAGLVLPICTLLLSRPRARTY
jgi:hypothetical protein